MNHCRDCNSDYATPGTCNCFAPGGKRSAARLTYPYPVWVPYYERPYTPTWTTPHYTLTTTAPDTSGVVVWNNLGVTS